MDVTGPFMQASIHESKYQCIIIDTFSKYVWTYFLITKDEVFEILSDFCETEILKLRERDKGNFALFLMSDLGEAHSNKIIKLYSEYGMLSGIAQHLYVMQLDKLSVYFSKRTCL